ncbi:transposase [Candidatus Bathyarchaeota archaeon]|nr:transposase [Candidatus Bathyarchaeota archaeon]
MSKEIVLGVDLGIKRSISTSAFLNYGDYTMYDAVTKHWGEANSWIEEWIVSLSTQLIEYIRTHNVNIMAMEDLNIESMTISENMKEYLKALKNGIELVAKENDVTIKYVDPRNTSKLCSNCGKIGRRKRRDFKCSKCGFTENADVNAAKNIGLRYIINEARETKFLGINPSGRYYLAMSYGPKSYEDFEWVRKTIET